MIRKFVFWTSLIAAGAADSKQKHTHTDQREIGQNECAYRQDHMICLLSDNICDQSFGKYILLCRPAQRQFVSTHRYNVHSCVLVVAFYFVAVWFLLLHDVCILHTATGACELTDRIGRYQIYAVANWVRCYVRKAGVIVPRASGNSSRR